MYFKEYTHSIISFVVNGDKRKWLRLSYALKGKKGLEIGGPSTFFRHGGYFPIYLFARKIDVVNYSNETVWEGTIAEGENYHYYKGKKGYQYIGEATDLREIKDNFYDFILSCHNLEHVANPLKALNEWKRVLKRKGKLILVLPDKNNTFDNKREYTRFEHLIEDFHSDVNEADSTHFDEIFRLHDLEKETSAVTRTQLRERLSENYLNRCAHHHVFSLPLIKEMLEFCGYKVILQQAVHNLHLVTFAELSD